MKKVLLFCMVFACMGTTLFTSCSTEVAPQKLIVDELISDADFENAVKSSLDILVLAKKNNWQENTQEISNLIDRVENGDVTAEGQLTLLLGMTRQEYLAQMESFAVAVVDLNNKYEELGTMTAVDRQALITDVIAQNEELQAYVGDLQAEFRGCFIQDLCNGIVTLARLIGGPILCDYIAGAIPVVGPLICNLVLGLAQDLLTGVCNALPC